MSKKYTNISTEPLGNEKRNEIIKTIKGKL